MEWIKAVVIMEQGIALSYKDHFIPYTMSGEEIAALAVTGMCFRYPDFVHISDIAKDEKIKCSMGYAFGLCSVGWLVIHFIVAVNVIIFSQSPFLYELYTFCMNGGMMVWFVYLLARNQKM